MRVRRFFPLSAGFVLAAASGSLLAQEGVPDVATVLGNRFVQTSTPLTNDKGVFEAYITHRFNGAAKDTGGGGLLGLDSGSAVGLGVEYVPIPNVAVQVYRVNNFADYEFALKATALRPTRELPIAIGVRGGLNWLTASYFAKQSSGFGQLLVSGTLLDRLTLAASPSYVQRTPFQQNVWNVPVIAQLKITKSISVTGELAPTKHFVPGSGPQWSASIEKWVHNHKFALWLGNSGATTVDQLIGGDYAGGVTDTNLHIGFNLTREWDLATD